MTDPIKDAPNSDTLPKNITDSELEKINIDDATQRKIQQNIDRIKFLNEMQKNTLVSKIISSYKAKHLQDKSVDI